jgi:glutathione-regulated potassium-efflux system ancillary protein KefG
MQDYHPHIRLLFVHPFPHRSRANRVLLESVRDVPGVHLSDLYEDYPDFHIDVEKEQQILRETDLLVVQHPLYWYSAPAMFKQWQDVVLEYGFAFGTGGDAVQGKDFISVITVGQSRESYRHDGHNLHDLHEILYPYECMANHCGMNYLEPMIMYSSHKLSDEQLSEWGDRYRQRLIAYRPGG